MALRLEVISDQRHALAQSAHIVFGVGGGTFGRASDNDWVLSDPQRYLSGHHGRIHFRQGAWYLEDLSTNGTFVNDSALPVSRTGPRALQDGDLLRFGEYEVRATIDAAEPTGATSSVIARSPSGTSVERVVPARVGTGEHDLGASFDLEALLHADGGKVRASRAAKQSATGARLQRLRDAARARLEGQPAQVAGLRSDLQAFCRGAGIETPRLTPDAELRLIHLAGQLLRELVLGLQDLARSRGEFRNSMGIEPGRETDATPALTRSGTDDYLLRLFAGHEQHAFDALLLIRDELKDAIGHQTALAGALPRAFTKYIAHLAPEEIESRFAAAGERASRANPWELYAEIFPTLTQQAGPGLPHLYSEALAQAYSALLRGAAE